MFNPTHLCRLLIAPSIVLAVFAAPPAFSQSVEQPAPSDIISDTRVTLDRWIEVRRLISKEKSDWALSEEVMRAQIEVMKRDIAEAKRQVQEQKEKLAGIDERIETLEQRNATMKSASAEVERFVHAIEGRVVRLLASAPEKLQDEVKPLAVQIPDQSGVAQGVADASVGADAAATASEDKGDAKPELPLARRVENVIGVLYLFNKAAGKIEQTNERVTRQDGTTLGVDAIYLGTSIGYYVDDEGKRAASGRPGDGLWTWTPIDAAGPRIREVISVFDKDQSAAFITLPAEVN